MKKNISNISARLEHAIAQKMLFLNNALSSCSGKHIFRQLENTISQYIQDIDETAKNMGTVIRHSLEISRERLNGLTDKLNALSPLSVLSRGYSITLSLQSGEVIKDARYLSEGEEIKTKLAKGEFISKVVNIKD